MKHIRLFYFKFQVQKLLILNFDLLLNVLFVVILFRQISKIVGRKKYLDDLDICSLYGREMTKTQAN